MIALLGLVFAYWGLHWMGALGAKSVPRLREIRIDGGVLLFTFALSLLSAVLFGLVPALRCARTDVQIPRFSEESAGLVERELNFFTNGRQTLKEEYIWVRTGVTIPASVWDPANKALPAWVGEWKK